MSKLGSLYIKMGSPEGELSGGCCEIDDWAADEIERLQKQVRVLSDALTEYMAAYNEHWKRGMPILEPMGDAALAAVREPADHIEHDLEKVRGPTSSPAGEGGDRG
jgi:hypothetical protein